MDLGNFERNEPLVHQFQRPELGTTAGLLLCFAGARYVPVPTVVLHFATIGLGVLYVCTFLLGCIAPVIFSLAQDWGNPSPAHIAHWMAPMCCGSFQVYLWFMWACTLGVLAQKALWLADFARGVRTDHLTAAEECHRERRSAFDVLAALPIAKLANAHKGEDGCRRLAAAAGYDVLHYLQAETFGTCVFIARSIEQPDCLCVSFRGTASPADIVTDACFVHTGWRHADDDIQVHTGFKQAWHNVASEVLGYVRCELTVRARAHVHAPAAKGTPKQPQSGGVTKVIFCGHSLGGSVASLAALEFMQDARTDGDDELQVDLFTFGTPRTGNARFTKELEKGLEKKGGGKCYRCVHSEDVVPMLPPGVADRYFKHAGTLIHCWPSEIRVSPSKTSLFVERLDNLFYLSSGYGFWHHRMCKYVEVLDRHCNAIRWAAYTRQLLQRHGGEHAAPAQHDLVIDAAEVPGGGWTGISYSKCHARLLVVVSFLSAFWTAAVLWQQAKPPIALIVPV
jgi:hypothetical protein